MLFTPAFYYLFLAISLIIYYGVPLKWRGYLLLLASYIFYTSFNPRYLIFILITTFMSFFCARAMMLTSSSRIKKVSISLALLVELLMLGFTKYWNTVADTTGLISHLEILVPLGISFYTFQSIGYLVDVYRDEIKAELNFARYALFISFFPHLLAGPIEPSQHFLPQIQKEKKFNSKTLAFGMMLIIVGLFKKLVIADRLKPFAFFIFTTPESHHGLSIALAAICARYQIYADFSGYTDIALGTAMMFGYNLTANFNRPFFSRSISEYWQRWHMSLTNWIRNYIFYPLLTSPVSIIGFSGLTIITFLALGIWHGLKINFLLYGLIQGILILIDAKTKHMRIIFYQKTKLIYFPRMLNTICMLFTFFLLVVPPTILFYSKDFSTSKTLIRNLVLTPWEISDLNFIFHSLFFKTTLMISFLGIILMETLDWIQKKKLKLNEYLWKKSQIIFYLVALVGVILILTYGKFDSGSKFIYFQF